mmetsp:Transcript_6985/g.30597  ORF Transcript_6985/g.30597 Transcript_6985/m.30597 type:complete len:91 (-) Transcript_6985:1197-1469(-)
MGPRRLRRQYLSIGPSRPYSERTLKTDEEAESLAKKAFFRICSWASVSCTIDYVVFPDSATAALQVEAEHLSATAVHSFFLTCTGGSFQR